MTRLGVKEVGSIVSSSTKANPVGTEYIIMENWASADMTTVFDDTNIPEATNPRRDIRTSNISFLIFIWMSLQCDEIGSL